MDDSIIQNLVVPFAAGFVIQRFFDIFDGPISKFVGNPVYKKLALGIASVLLGWGIACIVPVEIFHALLKQVCGKGIEPIYDHILSGIFISAGTEGFNSLMKFANYKKEASKADAATKLTAAGDDAVKKVNPQQ
jgi:hypothetical protein